MPLFRKVVDPDAPGTPSNPFASTADFPATGRYVGDEICLSYSRAPLGYVRWYWPGAKWKLSPDQVIVNYENDDGSPIFDQTATLLTPGTAYDIWTSDVLPSWLLVNGFRGAVAIDYGLVDAASTATVVSRLTIGDGLQLGTDASNALVGFNSAAANYSKGFPLSPVNFRVAGGAVFAMQGISPFSTASNSPRDQFQPIAAPRLRLNTVPGATTNRHRIWSVTLKTGPC